MDAGIVDQHIEAVILARDLRRGFRDAVCISDVQHERLDPSDTAKRFRCCSCLYGITCGEQHDEALAASCRQTSNPIPRLAPVTSANGAGFSRMLPLSPVTGEPGVRSGPESYCNVMAHSDRVSIWAPEVVSGFGKDLFSDRHSAHGTRPARVERQVRYRFDQFLLSYSVFHCPAEVKSQLVRTIQRDQRGDGYQTPVTF